jgi:hypothetical protein
MKAEVTIIDGTAAGSLPLLFASPGFLGPSARAEVVNPLKHAINTKRHHRDGCLRLEKAFRTTLPTYMTFSATHYISCDSLVSSQPEGVWH